MFICCVPGNCELSAAVNSILTDPTGVSCTDYYNSLPVTDCYARDGVIDIGPPCSFVYSIGGYGGGVYYQPWDTVPCDTVWSGVTNYPKSYKVYVNTGDVDMCYVSLEDDNLNHYPETSPTWWLNIGET